MKNFDKCKKIIYLGDYIDRGESGAKESRTEFDRIAYEGEVVAPIVDAVIVSSADRVARDIYIYYAFKHKMIQKGVKLISVKEDVGEMGVFSVVLESFIVAMSQIERETIKTRIIKKTNIHRRSCNIYSDKMCSSRFN